MELNDINKSGDLEGLKLSGANDVKPIELVDTVWDDIKAPLIGRNIDTATGDLDRDYYNGTVKFSDSCQVIANDCISMLFQMPHDKKESSDIELHLHWIQQESDEPNWLIGYKWYDNGATASIDTDFTGHLFLSKEFNAFTYSTGNLVQITSFGTVSTPADVSNTLSVVFFRDTNNDSSEFAGNDPVTGDVHALEFDIHYQRDDLGSREMYSK